MNKELQIRQYQYGDEDGIASLLTSCFHEYASFGLTGKRWLQYKKTDPGFDLDGAFIGEIDGKVVSHLQIVYRDLRVDELSFLRIGGISNVCTLPNYRNKGIASKLLTEAHRYILSKGIHTSALICENGGPAWNAYRKIGYTDVSFLTEFTVPMHHVLETLRSSSGASVSHYHRKHYREIMSIYNQYGINLSGVTKREMDYWNYKFFNVFTYDGLLYRDFDPKYILVVLLENKPVGYCFIHAMKNEGFIKEIWTPPNNRDVAEVLLYSACSSLMADGCKQLHVSTPNNTDAHSIMKELGAKLTTLQESQVFMTKILDNNLFLLRYQEILDTRLDAAGWKHTVIIKTDSNNTLFEVIIGDTTNKPYFINTRVNSDKLPCLIFGMVQPTDIKQHKYVLPKDEHVDHLSKILFTHRHWHLCPSDFW